MTIINWLIDRLKERSTKAALVTLVGILAALNIVPDQTPERVIEIVDQGQAIYHEGADSLASAIDLGKALYEEGRGAVIYAKDTATHFWQRIGQLLALVGILFGVFSKDAKGGKEYEQREALLINTLQTRAMMTDAEIRKVTG